MREADEALQRQICDYLAGAMPVTARLALEQRLAREPELRALVDDFTRVRANLARDPDATCAPGMTDRVMAELRKSQAAAASGLDENRELADGHTPAFVTAGRGRRAPIPRLFRIAAVLLLGAGLLIYARRPRPSRRVSAPARPTPRDAGTVAADSPAAGASDMACAWIARRQRADGSWAWERHGCRREVAVGVNGLALLALLQRDRFRKQAARAARHLLAGQGAAGGLGVDSPAAMYNHGIATLALLRARELGGAAPDLDHGLRKAVAYLLRAQNPDGGWSYRTTGRKRSNLAVTAWQVAALNLAMKLGISSRAAAQGLRRATDYVRSLVDASGHLAYTQAGASMRRPSNSLDAMGAFCLLLSPDPRTRAQGRGIIARVLQTPCGSRPRDRADPYCLYFLTQASRNLPSPFLGPALASARRLLSARQVAAGTEAGSVSPMIVNWGNVGGRIFATAMSAVALGAKPPKSAPQKASANHRCSDA